VQRPTGPRTLGQRLRTQSVHRWGDRFPVLLSIILTASVHFPRIDTEAIIVVVTACSMSAMVIYLAMPRAAPAELVDQSLRNHWRMPPLEELPPRPLNLLNKVWMLVLRACLVVAAGLVLVRILTLAKEGA